MLLKLFRFGKTKKPKIISYKSRADAFLRDQNSETKLRKLLHSFCDVTQINGFYYLRKEKTTKTSRVFWIFIPFMMLVFGGTLIHLLAEVYYDNPAIIVQLKPDFTSFNPFPSITVCPNEPFIYAKIVKLIEKTKIPPFSTRNNTELAIDSLTEFVYSANIINTTNTSVIESYLSLNNLSVTQLTGIIDMDCHDYIESFSLANEVYRCTPNDCTGLKKIQTIFGACCSFNYHPMDLSNVSVVHLSRRFAALNFLFSGRNLPGQGLSLIISYAGEYITSYDSSFKLYPGADNFFRVDVEKFIPSLDFKRLPFKSRRCMLPKDARGSANAAIYRSWCSFGCILEHIYKVCGCHPFNMPILTKQGATIRECGVIDLPCFSNKIGIWNVRCSHCLPTCDRVNYRVTSSNAAFDQKNSKSIFKTYENISKMVDPFTATIYYGRQTVKVFQQSARYNMIDLLSNLGGILNLTLGVSFITFFEILHYFVYKLIKT